MNLHKLGLEWQPAHSSMWVSVNQNNHDEWQTLRASHSSNVLIQSQMKHQNHCHQHMKQCQQMLLNDRATAPEVVEGESQPEQTPSCIASIEPCGTLNLACRSIIRLDPLIHFEKLLGCVLSVDERSVFKVATTNNQLCARFNWPSFYGGKDLSRKTSWICTWPSTTYT